MGRINVIFPIEQENQNTDQNISGTNKTDKTQNVRAVISEYKHNYSHISAFKQMFFHNRDRCYVLPEV